MRRADGKPAPRPPGHRAPPRFLAGPPHQRPDMHPPAPERVVFVVVDAPRFDDAWFEPDTHWP